MSGEIIQEDIAIICEELHEQLKTIEGSSWLVSGGAGFLGGYILDLLHYCNTKLLGKPCHVLCVENYLSGTPRRIKHLENDRHFRIMRADIAKPFHVRGNLDFIVHAASIASPTYYRKYPLETIEANVLGLKNLLDIAKTKELRGFLSFSTSEIYGDPPPEHIPTPEHYNGNVSCTGPRACYDESKRLGETLAAAYHQQYGIPIKVVRPFNIYGPGLRLEDKRVLADFFHNALFDKKIVIYSDGSPTRSFCYIRDAIIGFMQALFSCHNGEAFNIGNDQAEISIIALAELVAEVVGEVAIDYRVNQDSNYLTDNPQRRCPDLSKAKALLNYHPQVDLREGLNRSLSWYKEEYFPGGYGT